MKNILEHPDIGKHTKALRYTKWERFIFWATGRWPESVVEKRLNALYQDEQELNG